MEQKGKIKLPFTFETMLVIIIYLVVNASIILYFFTPINAYIESLPRFFAFILSGGYLIGTIALKISLLSHSEKVFEYQVEPVSQIYFRKKVRFYHSYFYIIPLFAAGGGLAYLVNFRPTYFDVLERYPIVSLFTITGIIALLLWAEAMFTEKLKTRYNFIGIFPKKGLPSQGVVVNEQGIFWDKHALHIAWHDVNMVTAEIIEIHQEDMILNASLHIHYLAGQTFTVNADYKDYDEVLEGICAAFQLHNAQEQLMQLYFEEESGCCTKLWQRQ